MKYLVDLPTNVSDRLRRYADDQQQTVEEIIASLVERDVDTLPVPEPPPPAAHTNQPALYDPWAGFHGAFEALSPDALDQHDHYLAMEAINPHDEEESPSEQDNADGRS